MDNKRRFNPKVLNNLIDLDVLITVLRMAFYKLDTNTTDLRISYKEILKHLNIASFIKKDRIKEGLLTLVDVPFNIDGLEATPVISRLCFEENGGVVTVYFHPKVYLALKRGYFFDGLDYMPVQTINKEVKEKVLA